MGDIVGLDGPRKSVRVMLRSLRCVNVMLDMAIEVPGKRQPSARISSLERMSMYRKGWPMRIGMGGLVDMIPSVHRDRVHVATIRNRW